MARDTVIKATIDIGAKITDFQTAIKSIQGELNKLSVGSEVGKDLENAFKKVQEGIGNISRLTKNNELNIVDRKEVESTFRKLEKDWDGLIGKLESKKVTSSPLKEESKALAALKQLRDQYNKAITGGDSKIEAQTQKYNKQLGTVKNLASEYEKLNNKTGALTIKRDVANQDLKAAEDALKIRKAETEELRKAAEEAKKLLATREEQRRIEEENFNKQYVEEHNNRKGIKNAREAHMTEWAKPYEEAEEAIRKYNEAIKEQQDAYDKAKVNADSAQKALDENTEALSRTEEAWKKAKKSLSGYQGALTRLTGAEFQKLKDQLNLEDVGIDPNSIHSYEQLEKVIEQLSEEDKTKATQVVQNIKKYAETSAPAIDKMSESINQAGNQLDGLNERQKQLDQMRNSVLQFFSIGNAVNLFKRAIRAAVETVKDLDKVMTETAVVTEFSVGDMWTQLPEYAKRANELGVSIHDVYEASTLYYQQGLKTNEVMAVTNATLRMARIAGLEAAEATDRVTNALRGFNMEINEANADNIADVYSKLAAISASNVDEISTAMTKVASLANSANMQFENTAAFLAQIIETTRESAETAGTALKTVVARFSEVKELYSKNELFGTDEEGEEIDVNKVSQALRTAGINLNEFLVGQKGLDEIFMELASKWNDLDIVQQRYIATMAAGSRQQSRFIALMSDYSRTQELTAAAQNANGAATEQYNKTLESLETKVTRLKNAWNQFLMSIANSKVIKGAVDMLTGLVNTLNKVVDAVSGGNGLLKSIAAIGLSVSGLKLGRKIFNGLFGNPSEGSFLKGWVTNLGKAFRGEESNLNKIGQQAGSSIEKGVESSFSNLKNYLKKAFSSTLTASDLGIKSIDLSDSSVVGINNKDDLVNSIFDKEQEKINALSQEAQNKYFQLSEGFSQGKINVQEYSNSLKELGISTEITGEQADKLGIKFKNQAQAANIVTTAVTGTGATLLGLGTIIEKISGKSTGFTRVIKKIGVGLMTFGSLLPMVGRAFQAFGISVSTTIKSIPIIGWIAAIISAVITLISILTEVIETPAEAAENAKQALDQAVESANAAKDAIENLNSSYNELIDKSSKLDAMIKGTREWRQAVQENNKAVLDLLANYRELNIVSNKDGILEITNFDEVLEMYQKREQNLQTQTIGAHVRSIQADKNLAISNAKNDFKLGYSNAGESSNIKFTNDQYEQLAKLVADGVLKTVKDTNEYIQDNFITNEDQSFTSLTEENFQSFRAFGDTLNSLNKQLNTYYNSMGVQALQYADLTDEQQKFANSLSTATQSVRDSYETFKSGLTEKNLSNESQEEQVAYRKWVAETFGEDVYVSSSGDFTDSTGKSWDYNSEETKAAFAAWYTAANDFKEQIEVAAKYLEKISGSKNKGLQSLAKSYEGTNGEELTRQDLDNIKAEIGQEFVENFETFKLSDLDDQNLSLYQTLYDYWNSEENKELREAFGDDFKAWAETLATDVFSARDAFKQADMNFSGDSFKEATANFTSGVVAELTKQLSQYKPDDIEGDFGANIVNSLSKLIGTETTGDVEKLKQVVSAFSKVALNSEDELKDFKKTLSAMGFNVAESEFQEFIDGIKKSITVLTQVDVKKIDEALPELSKIVEGVESGEQTREFSKETYDKLKELGFSNELMDDFIRREDGSYLYLGDKLDTIATEIKQQTKDLLGEGRKQLEAKQVAADIANEIQVKDTVLVAGTTAGSIYRETTEEEKQLDWLSQFVQGYAGRGIDIGQIGVEGLYEGINLENLASETVARMVTQAKEVVANQVFWDESLKELEGTEFASNLLTKTMDELIGELDPSKIQEAVNSEGIDFSTAQGAIISSIFAKASDIPPEILDQYISETSKQADDVTKFEELASLNEVYSKAINEGLDTEQLQIFADTLNRTKKIALDGATQIAAENIKLNLGVKNIIGSYDDWNHLIEEGTLGSGQPIIFKDSESHAAFDTLKQNLTTALNLTHDLSDAFFESSENMEELVKLTNGSAEEKNEALVALSKAAAIDMLSTFDIVSEDYNTLVTWIEGIDLEPLEVGAILEDEAFIAELDKMVAIAGEAGAAMAGELGFEQQKVQTGSFTYYLPPTQDELIAAGKNGGKLDLVTREVPTFGLRWVRTGGAGVTRPSSYHSPLSHSNLTNTGAKPTSSSKDSGSGVDKEEKEKLWKNPYDELYNLQEKVNDALREREKLEHRYEDMLKDHTKTAEDLTENTWAEVAALKQQLQLNKQLLAGRKGQMSRVGNEMFEDSEGNRATLVATGATKYAYYDETTGVVQIDYDAIDKITDENLGNAVEQYISRLEEIRDQINDTEDTIEDINDQLFDIQDRGKEEYLGFEQKVYDAIVNQRQKEIETLEKINDTVTEATNKTISTIQDEISKERQARENDKAEQDIMDKEMRLAYLQRDTSGANDLEIQKLQEEIANDQQSYQDSIIDQTIQEMQDEAERAAEQRQAQIDLLNYILEFDQQYGLIWENVEGLLQAGIDNQGVIKTDSDLYKLLDGDNSPLSHFGEEQWKIDLAKEIAIAMQGRTNYQLAEAKEQGTAQLANGTVLTYNKASDKWTDKNGNEYTDLTWNLQANGFDAIKHNKPQTKQPGSGNTGTGNKGGTEDKDAPETVTYTIQKNDGPWQVAQAVYGSAAEANAQWQDVQSQLQAQGINELHPGQVVKIRRRYAQGGLADFTGPAWLDGTKSRPEMVLNAADTQNFITLKNILAQILNNTKNGSQQVSGGNNYFDIDIQAEIDSDYDVDRLADRIKQQIAEDASYRNVNMISQVR